MLLMVSQKQYWEIIGVKNWYTLASIASMSDEIRLDSLSRDKTSLSDMKKHCKNKLIID